MSHLELRGISKTFRDRAGITPAVRDISFAVESGQFVTLIGPSGSGKSTLFNLITGLVRPDSGDILLNGTSITGRTGCVGYMPQKDLLLPWRTVLDNVVIAPEIAHRPRDSSRARARELLPTFGLEAFADTYPAALSGGMRQRAALLRTFLAERDVMLLDEPFGALDALTRRDLQTWLLGVWSQFKPTILFVTHDVGEAVLLGTRAIVFSARPGQIKLEVPIDLPYPRDETSAAFLRLRTRLLEALS
ncbi:MAG TPA: ABC transporter ATP-binding protein [Aggregatilineales bacterium]|nr:ABC transporter ATP-binding protein [Aggregatilineales bacterium]